jgi:two-component system response regulator HydG
MKSKLSVLIVDDASDFLELMGRHAAVMGFNSFKTNSVVNAIEILETTSIDLIITDMNMPEISGQQLVRYVSQHFPDLPVLVITGYPDIQDAVSVMKLGALEYLVKPFTFDELQQAVNKVLSSSPKTSTNEEEALIHSTFHGIIGKSKPMQALYQTIERTKNNNATVLITGESGTGKEMVARAIHYNSQFSSAPFVAVNCGAIPDQLLESELFGHVKGAFTGATNSRIGFFQAANGGTLFLDEITNASLSVQAKLLRAIQEKEVTMVGDTKSQKINLRLISASNTEMEEAIKNNSFREDLYYRLNVITIAIPPLRERKEDIPLLIIFFNKKHSKDNKKSPLKINSNIVQLFEEYAWPGNVRELENLIHRLVILCDKNVTMEQIPSYMKYNPDSNSKDTELLTLKEVEKRHILKVLAATDNNKTKAAEILGIDRKTLRMKVGD